MKYKFSQMLAASLFIVLLTSMNASADNREVEFSNYIFDFEIDIKSAFYLDADDDGSEDDVRSYFNIDVDQEHDWDEYYEKQKLSLNSDTTSYHRNKDIIIVQFTFTLVLGSGKTFTHDMTYELEEGKSEFELTLFNEALESGYYDLYITMKTSSGGYAKGTAWINFDPPGGTSGDPGISYLRQL